VSSTGLPSRTAAALSYSGWWVTGAIFWFLERRDPLVRFHAAQALVIFGILALQMMLCGLLAAASLTFLPSLFIFFAGATALGWVTGVVVWGMAMWRAARGDEWRMPVVARWADRLV
jgi:uncharacterized membrane protein